MVAGNRVPEGLTTLSPTLQTPASDILKLPLSQQGRICGFFETQLWRCMEAYGAKLGRKYCDLEYRDYNECMTNGKQTKRAEAIRAQYEKLYSEGKIKTPFVENHPPPGQFKPDHFQWKRIN